MAKRKCRCPSLSSSTQWRSRWRTRTSHRWVKKKRWVKKNIPQGKGHFIYTSLLGTAADLSTAENVQASQNILLLCSTRCSHVAQPGGNLHGAGEHQDWRSPRFPRNFHHKRKSAHPVDQQESWLSDSLNNSGVASIVDSIAVSLLMDRDTAMLSNSKVIFSISLCYPGEPIWRHTWRAAICIGSRWSCHRSGAQKILSKNYSFDIMTISSETKSCIGISYLCVHLTLKWLDHTIRSWTKSSSGWLDQTLLANHIFCCHVGWMKRLQIWHFMQWTWTLARPRS